MLYGLLSRVWDLVVGGWYLLAFLVIAYGCLRLVGLCLRIVWYLGYVAFRSDLDLVLACAVNSVGSLYLMLWIVLFYC